MNKIADETGHSELYITNNLSEQAIRCVKSHMKILGQFELEETAVFTE